MQNVSNKWLSDMASPARKVTGKVELLRGSTILKTYLPTDKLVSVKLEKTPVMGSFFGYTLSQKATIEILDRDNDFTLTNVSAIRVSFGNEEALVTSPRLFIDDVKRDEVKKIVTITAFDMINDLVNKNISGLQFTNFPVSIKGFTEELSRFTGCDAIWDVNWEVGNELYNLLYTEDNFPNFSSNDNIRSLLGYIAEATGTICYMDAENHFCFKQLNNYDEDDSLTTIEKADYFNLTIGEPITLKEVASYSDLGDNVSAKDGNGAIQILRNNPFIVNRNDIGEILERLLGAVKGLKFYPYELRWRGLPALDIGDYVRLETQNGMVNIYYLGETLTYNGGLSSLSEWKDEEQQREASNSSTLGAVLSETFARVDKANRKIEMVASEAEINNSRISSLEITTESITGTVERLERAKGDTDDLIVEINKRLETTITSEELRIAISEEINSGTTKVETETGYKFDKDGLTISKSDSDIQTTITENGMKVEKRGNEVLIADSKGVKAIDLHAETYLIIGKNSRLEDYNNGTRTGCFWIGGQ